MVKEEPETLFTQDDRQLVSTYTVPYSDIDTNRHLNNTHYLRIASNLIPVEAYENHFMDSISINYKKKYSLIRQLNSISLILMIPISLKGM